MDIEEEIDFKGIVLYNFFSNKRLDIFFVGFFVLQILQFRDVFGGILVFQFFNEGQLVRSSEFRVSQDILGFVVGVLVIDYVKMDYEELVGKNVIYQ